MPFFWSYLIHFILEFDGVKSKVGLLNPCNLSRYLASPPASLPEMPWLAVFFGDISTIADRILMVEKQRWSLVYLSDTI